MAGTLVANTINTDTGLFSTNNAYSGIGKAWVNFGYVSSAITIRGSFNVSSVTRNGTGDFTINFTTAMPDANYASAGSAQLSLTGDRNLVVSAPFNQAPTTSALRIATTGGATSSLLDLPYVSVVILGN